jgi:hypothetical protein
VAHMAAGAARGRDGVRILNFSIDKDGEARRRAEQAVEGNVGTTTTKKKRGGAPEVGNALRAAYDQTLGEDIPPEMLDLLGKLG